MKAIRKRLTYANVMSSIAVFLVIGGGAAFAALGKNTVGTKQLKKNAVTTAKIKAQAVASGKIKNSAIVTGKIANDAVTGDKVNESTLGVVPNASNAGNASRVGGVPASALTVGRSSHEISCFGSVEYICASLTMSLPRKGRVLLVSQLPMHADAENSSASCHLTFDGIELPDTETTPGANEDADSNEGSEIANGGVTVVTDVLPAGEGTFEQVCSDTDGNPHFRHTSLSAVLLGTD